MPPKVEVRREPPCPICGTNKWQTVATKEDHTPTKLTISKRCKKCHTAREDILYGN